jgi:hypothetical protein
VFSNVLQDAERGQGGTATINGFKNIYDTRHTRGFSEGKFRGNVCSLASGNKVMVGVTLWK